MAPHLLAGGRRPFLPRAGRGDERRGRHSQRRRDDSLLQRPFRQMLDAEIERVMGGKIAWFCRASRNGFEALLRAADGHESRGELELLGTMARSFPLTCRSGDLHG